MSTIGAALDREWAAIRSHLPHPHYHATNETPEASMTWLSDIHNEILNAVNWAEDEFRAKLPTVARLADTAEAVSASAPVQAVLSAVLSPEDEALLVSFVQRLDRSAHNLQAGDPPQPAEPAPAA